VSGGRGVVIGTKSRISACDAGLASRCFIMKKNNPLCYPYSQTCFGRCICVGIVIIEGFLFAKKSKKALLFPIEKRRYFL